jgi:hypothetical protein
MRQTVSVTCNFCGNQLDKLAKSVKWARANGQKNFYCNMVCMQSGRTLGRVKPGTALRSLLCRYKQTARRRKVSFTLTDTEFGSLVTQSCYYCGDAPAQVARAKSGETLKYNGIDRVNNLFGYSTDNSVSCCGTCNRWKSSMSSEDFLAQIRKIFERTTMVTNLSKTAHTA